MFLWHLTRRILKLSIQLWTCLEVGSGSGVSFGLGDVTISGAFAGAFLASVRMDGFGFGGAGWASNNRFTVGGVCCLGARWRGVGSRARRAVSRHSTRGRL